MRPSSRRSVSLIEWAVVLSLAGMIGSCIFPDLSSEDLRARVRARDAVREAEVKANIHTIQAALERYATDHNGCYPAYIFGGDVRGWDVNSGCRALTTAESEDLRPPRDPLIEFGYLSEYPSNPFIDPSEAAYSIINWTSDTVTPGNGDVRFGWSGEKMGNCLDDPRCLYEGYGIPTRLQYTLIPVPEKHIAILDEQSSPFYCMGGIPPWDKDAPRKCDPEGETENAFWPGEFFYRAGGEFSITDTTTPRGEEYQYIWAWPYVRIDKYILGGFGSIRTEGLDVIRLTTKEGYTASVQPGAFYGAIEGEYYQDQLHPDRKASHPDFDVRVAYSNPEVFGGGEHGLMPQFPYYYSGTCHWIFGAPDGRHDGVVIVLISGVAEPFAEWEE